MISALAQRDHRRSPGRTGVVLVIPLEVDFMMCCEGDGDFAPVIRLVNFLFALFAFYFASLTNNGGSVGVPPSGNRQSGPQFGQCSG